MNNQQNIKCQIIPHPEYWYKDEWVLSRESIHTGGLIIDHHLEPPDEIENQATNHHIIGYLLNDFSPRQITRIDDKEYDGSNERGDFWLKPSHTDGFWRWESTDECLIFAIKPAFLRQVAMENNCLNPDKIEILPIVISRDTELDILVMLFKREMDRAEFAERLYIESLANLFAIHLLRHYCAFPAKLQKYEGGLPPYKLRQAIDYINANLDRKLKLDDVAQLIDLSQFYFCHLFKQSTGVAPYQYIIQQRVAKAQQLIKQKKLPLAEIALECGFSSQSQMTQHFRKCVGVTPKAYRNH
ncbi:MAG: helix-turn-helix domain-containing protein [Waterburya sp.]